jgi:cysteine desulfurase/selenocysteine lyase
MNEQIRSDFPIVKNIIYMDSAATSLTPEPVLEAISHYYREYNANVGRGVHRLSLIASQRYREAHRKIAEFIGGKEEDVIFTKNATESINLVAYGLPWGRGDEVVTTMLEHHSNFLPWLRLKAKGVIVHVVKPNRDGLFDIADFEDVITPRTKLVAVTHISNVLGSISPIKELSGICNEYDTLLLIDGAQSAPHIRIDVKELGCDFFAFSGHKMLGPTGTGVLWVKDSERIEPTFYGGGMVADVSQDTYTLTGGYERFEAGTPHIAGGVGLGRAVDYLEEVGIHEIMSYESKLTKQLLDGLLSLEHVHVYGSTNLKDRIGVISFNIKGKKPDEVACMLDEASAILVRSGHHCCMPLMNYLGLKDGTVRESMYLYNTEEEVDTFLETVEEVAKVV